MKIALPPVRFAGSYSLETCKADGTPVRKIPTFHNVITDYGLDQIGNTGYGDDSFYGYTPCVAPYCHVGTGNNTPTEQDTTLETWVAQVKNANVGGNTYHAGPPRTVTSTHTWTFGVGVAAGNLTEVGLGQSHTYAGGSYIFSRALILDGNGNPTTLVVASDELLKVTYTLTAYLPDAPSPQVLTLDGVDYTITWYAYGDDPSGYNADWGSPPRIKSGFRDYGSAGSYNAYAGAPNFQVYENVNSILNGNGQQWSNDRPGRVGDYSPGSHTQSWSEDTSNPVNTGADSQISFFQISAAPHGELRGVVSPPIPVLTGQHISYKISASWDRYTPPA